MSMFTVELKVPEAVRELGFSDEEICREVPVLLVLKRFRQGAISSSKGARILGLWRRLRRSVQDLPERAIFSQEANERYLEALAATAETRTVKELIEPLTRRVPEPGSKRAKKKRAS